VTARTGIRLAELLGVLSLATDLGMAQPMEHVLRQCLISLRLAERMGQRRPPLLGRPHRDQERHRHLLRILKPRRQADRRLALHDISFS
jgi:hypothetical protein